MGLDLFTDADFAGLYNVEAKDDPTSVKSWSGILMTFGDVPILWISKLQSDITLSILESDYIALSQGMRGLVLAQRLVKELCARMNLNMDNMSRVSKAWEDNTGTQNLANCKGPLMTA